MRTTVFKLLKTSGALGLLSLADQSPVILCLHRISYEKSNGYPPLSPDVLEAMIKHLHSRADFIDFKDLSVYNSKKPAVIVSFDDAFTDFRDQALPILNYYNVPVTLNVIPYCASTGLPHWTQKIACLIEEFARRKLQPELPNSSISPLVLGKNEEQVALELCNELYTCSIVQLDNILQQWEEVLQFDSIRYTQMLNWEELRQMLSLNEQVYIGNHTYHHLNLQVQRTEQELQKEIVESHHEICSKLNVSIDRFAFPNGAFNEHSLRKVNELNYKFIQLTSNMASKQRNCYQRVNPCFQSSEENLFLIYGLHEKIKSMVRQ